MRWGFSTITRKPKATRSLKNLPRRSSSDLAGPGALAIHYRESCPSTVRSTSETATPLLQQAYLLFFINRRFNIAPAPILLITIPHNSRYLLFQQRRLMQSSSIPFRPLTPKTGCSSTPPMQNRSSSSSMPWPPRFRLPSQRPGSYWATTRSRPISPASTLRATRYSRAAEGETGWSSPFLKNLSLVFWESDHA